MAERKLNTESKTQNKTQNKTESKKNNENLSVKEVDEKILALLERMFQKIIQISSKLALENVISVTIFKTLPENLKKIVLLMLQKENEKQKTVAKKKKGGGRGI
jgi:hypothetical protein